MFKVPDYEIKIRMEKLRKLMREKGIDAMFIVQRMDLFYFSGTAQNGCLYVSVEKEPLLFIRKYMPRAVDESSVRHIIEIKSVKDIPDIIMQYHGKIAEVIGFELDVMPVNEFDFYRKLLSCERYADGSGLIFSVRMIKSDWEIEQMEHTAEISHKVFNYIKKVIKPGISEMEFSGVYETYARKLGHAARLRARNYHSELYNWHILSGKNGGVVGMLDSPASGMGTSPAHPCGGTDKLLCPGEPIMIDIGTNVNGYHIDETRMFAMDFMPEEAEKACRAVIDIHNAIIKNALPGTMLDTLYREAVDMAREMGYEKQFLGPDKYKVTFIGHGVGLEIVEPPFIAKGKKEKLTTGMVFALEPKMVFENRFSAGIESVFVVTKTGGRLLSSVPVDIFINH